MERAKRSREEDEDSLSPPLTIASSVSNTFSTSSSSSSSSHPVVSSSLSQPNSTFHTTHNTVPPSSSSVNSSSVLPSAPARMRIPCSARGEFILTKIPDSLKRAFQLLILDYTFSTATHPEVKKINTHRFIHDRPELCGPLPISMNRRLVDTLLQYPYRVCEKSDGERIFLLCLPSSIHSSYGHLPSGTYIINRTFDISSFERHQEYCAILGNQGPTLLDGELIIRKDDAGTGTGAKAVFMMFDALRINGIDVTLKKLDERLTGIANYVRGPFTRTDTTLLNNKQPGLPLYLLGKFMVEIKDIKQIVDKIQYNHHHHHAHPHSGNASSSASNQYTTIAPLESNMGKEESNTNNVSASSSSSSSSSLSTANMLRIYHHDIRINGTDGLIFTPVNCSYHELFLKDTPTPILKWKYNDEHTVDFRLQLTDIENLMHERIRRQQQHSPLPPPTSLSSSVSSSSVTKTPPSSFVNELILVPLYITLGGRDDKPITKCELSLSQGQQYIEIGKTLGTDEIIVECGYNLYRSVWDIRRIRDRKTKANFITTGWSTLEALAENLTIDELVQRLTTVHGKR